VIALHSPDGNLQTGPPVSPPEKRAAELVFWVQQDTFSESGFSTRHAELWGFPAILRGKLQSFLCVQDCMAEDAVTSEPFSGLNSLLTGKNTGNFMNFAGPFRPLVALNASFCATSTARTNFLPWIEQGIIRGLSGNSKPLIRELSFLPLMSPGASWSFLSVWAPSSRCAQSPVPHFLQAGISGVDTSWHFRA